MANMLLQATKPIKMSIEKKVFSHLLDFFGWEGARKAYILNFYVSLPGSKLKYENRSTARFHSPQKKLILQEIQACYVCPMNLG